jgi:hypothetical protein
MENTAYNDPKDDQITNQDDSVTNKDGDNNLEQGEQPNIQDKPDEERVPTVTPAHDSGDPTPPKGDEDSDSSNKDGGPAEENL